MTWKVKDLQKQIRELDDEDVLIVRVYDPYDECYYSERYFELDFRKPKRTEFTCPECKQCTIIDVDGEKMNFCKKNGCTTTEESCSCSDFEHNFKKLEYS